MNETKIEWCDSTWNPITGCNHSCEYCYARGIVRRFEGKGDLREKDSGLLMSAERIEAWSADGRGPIIKRDFGGYEVKYALTRGERPEPSEPYHGRTTPYPFGFVPTLHRYRLERPQKMRPVIIPNIGADVDESGEPTRRPCRTRARNIFVGSMADVFGEWVPDEWIGEVFEACKAAPQHGYLFLTKNPKRYWALNQLGMLPHGDNFWFGFTVTNQRQLELRNQECGWTSYNTFVSIEPLHGPVNVTIEPRIRWAIIGAETGNRKKKVAPERAWIVKIVEDCRAAGVPVFMKDSLAPTWGEPLLREYPVELRKEVQA